MKLILTLLSLFILSTSFAEPVESAIYKGTVGTHKVTLYIGKGEGCGDDYYYTAMYSYDEGKHWLLLNTSRNSKGFYCMVENDFTGVLMLTDKAVSLEGTWYSPDRSKALEVKLTKEKSSAKKLKETFDLWDKLNYETNDC